jgi:hypothetical protein
MTPSDSTDSELLYVVERGPDQPDDWFVVHQASGRPVARFLGALEATEHAEQLTDQAHRESERLLAEGLR